jgi:hypothetical protein
VQARLAKKIRHEIEAAAMALGFPRRISYARVRREFWRYTPRLDGMAELDLRADRPRFRAVAALYRLMEKFRNLDRRIAAARRQVVKLRRDVILEAACTRKRVDKFIAEDAAWKALTPRQRDAILKAEQERDAAKRIARWEKLNAKAVV